MNKKILILVIVLAVLIISLVSFFAFVPNSIIMKQASAGNIKVDDYVKFGSYYGDPILWRCVDKSNGTMLVSEYILCMKPYDAAESGKWGNEGVSHASNVNVQKYGSKDWVNSNIREWLNSDANKVKFSTQPPVKAAVLKGENAYADEPGFLTNFTKAERSNIKAISHDGCSDRVYVLSADEVHKYIGGNGPQVYTSNDTLTIRMLTQKARENSAFKIDAKYSNDWWYYTRTPIAAYPTDVTLFTFGGGFFFYDNHVSSGIYPGTGNAGVLPALNLKNDSCKSGNGKEDNPWVLQ